MKISILGILGCAGAFISGIFGGWNDAMTTLVIFMLIDYVCGLIVAGVFHKSSKSEDGGLESRAGYKGLIRKFSILLVVLIACRLDMVIGTDFIRDAVIISFIANETLSITENIGLMGVPLPEIITRAITILNERSKDHDFKEND